MVNEQVTSPQGMLQAGDWSHQRDVRWHYKTLDLLYLGVAGLVLGTAQAGVQGLQ